MSKRKQNLAGTKNLQVAIACIIIIISAVIICAAYSLLLVPHPQIEQIPPECLHPVSIQTAACIVHVNNAVNATYMNMNNLQSALEVANRNPNTPRGTIDSYIQLIEADRRQLVIQCGELSRSVDHEVLKRTICAEFVNLPN